MLKALVKEDMHYHNTYYWGLRNSVIDELGYSDYSDYLDSDLWKNIRRRVFAKSDRCHCGERGSQVHHSRYTHDNLAGDSLSYLHAICRQCHMKEHGLTPRQPKPKRKTRKNAKTLKRPATCVGCLGPRTIKGNFGYCVDCRDPEFHPSNEQADNRRKLRLERLRELRESKGIFIKTVEDFQRGEPYRIGPAARRKAFDQRVAARREERQRRLKQERQNRKSQKFDFLKKQ